MRVLHFVSYIFGIHQGLKLRLLIRFKAALLHHRESRRIHCSSKSAHFFQCIESCGIESGHVCAGANHYRQELAKVVRSLRRSCRSRHSELAVDAEDGGVIGDIFVLQMWTRPSST